MLSLFFSLFSAFSFYYLLNSILYMLKTGSYMFNFPIFYFTVALTISIIGMFKISEFFLKKNVVDMWFVLGLFSSVFIAFFGYLYLSPLYVGMFPMTYDFKTNMENLNISYNLVDIEPHEYAQRGDRICFNMTIKNNNPSLIQIYLGSYIVEPTGKSRISGNVTYNTNILDFESNTTRNNVGNCEQFVEPGLNKFYPYLEVEMGNRKNTIYPNGIYVDVKSGSEYRDLTNQKSLLVVFSLAVIPIVLSAVKTLKELAE